MEAAWQPEGFCVPHASVYPFQWLWDSCFHAVVWAELGDDRCLTEIRSALANQDPHTGFVPHLTYWSRPDHHASFWGRSLTSSITQPPMYGHALACIVDAGVEVDDDTFARARAGLRHLLDRRRSGEVLVPVFHPWETGCDDSPRWDAWAASERPWDAVGWKATKGDLVADLVVDEQGFAVDSATFRVPSCGFNALVVWNCAELDRIGQSDDHLRQGAEVVRSGIAERWSRDLRTWTDDTPSGSVRTADALLCLLIDPRPEAVAELVDPMAFAGPFGIRGVHAAEASYDPDTYWRGPSWPQLDYLLLLALRRVGANHEAAALAGACARGANRSGMAEYWNAETGSGGGAIPQTWTALAQLFRGSSVSGTDVKRASKTSDSAGWPTPDAGPA